MGQKQTPQLTTTAVDVCMPTLNGGEIIGERHSFNAVVDRINDELDTDVDPEYVENPIPDSVYVNDTCADPTKINEATGWEPEITFEEGIRRVCAQYR